MEDDAFYYPREDFPNGFDLFQAEFSQDSAPFPPVFQEEDNNNPQYVSHQYAEYPSASPSQQQQQPQEQSSQSYQRSSEKTCFDSCNLSESSHSHSHNLTESSSGQSNNLSGLSHRVNDLSTRVSSPVIYEEIPIKFYADSTSSQGNNTSSDRGVKKQISKSKKKYDPLFDNSTLFVYENNPEEYKKARKRLQNRQSARKVRGLKKSHEENLEINVDELEKENQELRVHLAELTAQNQRLKDEVSYFRGLFRSDHHHNNNNKNNNNGVNHIQHSQPDQQTQSPQQYQPNQGTDYFQQNGAAQQGCNQPQNTFQNSMQERNDWQIEMRDGQKPENSINNNNINSILNGISPDLPTTAVRVRNTKSSSYIIQKTQQSSNFQLFVLVVISCMLMASYSTLSSSTESHSNVLLQFEKQIISNTTLSAFETLSPLQLSNSLHFMVNQNKLFQTCKHLSLGVAIAGYIGFAIFVLFRVFKHKLIFQNKQKNH